MYVPDSESVEHNDFGLPEEHATNPGDGPFPEKTQ